MSDESINPELKALAAVLVNVLVRRLIMEHERMSSELMNAHSKLEGPGAAPGPEEHIGSRK